MKFLIIFLLLIFSGISLSAQWGPDQKLSTGTDEASLNENMGKCIAVNGNTIHVVWVQATGGSGIYYKRSSDAGITWGNVTRLTGNPSISDFPSIAVSGNNVHVAYRDSAAGQRTSNYIRSTDGGNSWGAPVSLGNYFFWPSVSVSGTTVYVALNSNAVGNSEIWFRRSTNNGSTWETPIQISNASGRSEDPSIASVGNTVQIVWNDNRMGVMQTFYCRSMDKGVTWGPEIQRTHSTTFAYSPSVSVYNADVDIVWADRRNGSFDIYHLHSPDFGDNWSGEDPLSSDPSSSVYPTLVRNGTNVHVIWSGNGLTYRFSSDGGTTWNSPVTIVSASYSPTLSFVEVTGDIVHVVWTDQRDGNKAIYYKRNPTGNAGPPTNTISVTSVPTQLCTGADFPVQYLATGLFFGDNLFTAQLSDGNGDFSNPVDIGSINATASGTITATVPYFVTPASNYRVRVNSSSPDFIGTKNTSNITINNHPIPVILGTAIVCQNSSQTFSSPFTAGHSYKWTVTGGTITSADTLRTINVTWVTSNPSGTVTLLETIVSTGCSDTVTKTITLVPIPTPNIQGPVTSCRNNIQTFSTNFVKGHAYKWTVNGGIIIGPDSANTLVVNWESLNLKGTITVMETTIPTGCFRADTHYVALTKVPQPVITGDNNICVNNYVNYSAFPAAGHSYLWRVVGGDISGANNQPDLRVYWNTSNPSGTITLIERIDSTGCSDSTSEKITINTLPVVTITGPTTVPKGSLKIYSGPSSGIIGYKWYAVGGIIQGFNNQKDVTVIWGNLGIGSIKLICTNSNGCVDSLQKGILISNTPLAISGSDTVCSQYSTIYTTKYYSGRTNLWVVSGGVIEGSAVDTLVQIKWGPAGNGVITLTQTITANQFVDSVSLNVLIKPSPDAVITGLDTAFRGTRYTYSASQTDGTYLWEVTNGTINGLATEQTVDITWEYDMSGYIKLTETNSAACTDTASLEVLLRVNSVNDNTQNSNSLKSYPNPSSGIINFEFNNSSSDYFEIEITNVYGQTVKELYAGRIDEGNFKTQWNGTDASSNFVSSGIYFVKIKSESLNITEKLVLIK